jgi:hypothetical protein
LANLKETNKLLKHLAEHFPIPTLSHLKRLKKTPKSTGVDVEVIVGLEVDILMAGLTHKGRNRPSV